MFDALPLREFVSLILRCEFTRAGVEPPTLTPAQHRGMVRVARLGHRLPPDAPPVELAEAEDFKVYKADLPRRCGCSEGDKLFIPKAGLPEDLRLALHHERTHGWGARWHGTFNEADAWLMTPWFTHPPGEPCAYGLPPWYCLAAEDYISNVIDGFLTPISFSMVGT